MGLIYRTRIGIGDRFQNRRIVHRREADGRGSRGGAARVVRHHRRERAVSRVVRRTEVGDLAGSREIRIQVGDGPGKGPCGSRTSNHYSCS